MPSPFADAEAAKLDARRAVYSPNSRIYAIANLEGDTSGWVYVETGNDNGQIKAGWQPTLSADENELSVLIVETKKNTSDILFAIGGFQFIKDIRVSPDPVSYMVVKHSADAIGVTYKHTFVCKRSRKPVEPQ